MPDYLTVCEGHQCGQVVWYDIIKGSLAKDSNIRPTRIFTADKGIIIKTVGEVSEEKFREVKNKIIRMIDPPEDSIGVTLHEPVEL